VLPVGISVLTRIKQILKERNRVNNEFIDIPNGATGLLPEEVYFALCHLS